MNTTIESKDDELEIEPKLINLLSNDSSGKVQPSVSEGQQKVLLNVEEVRKITRRTKSLKMRKKYSPSSILKLSCSGNDTRSTDSSSEEQNDKNTPKFSKRKMRRKPCISLKKKLRIERNKSSKSTSGSDSEPNNSILLNPNIPVSVINNLNVGIRRTENDKGKETDFTPSEQTSDAVYDDQNDERLFEKKDIPNKRDISYSLKENGLKNISLVENLSNMMQKIGKNIEYPTNLETNTKKKTIVKFDSDSSRSDILVESPKVETITINADSTSGRLAESSKIETITIDSDSPASIILDEDSEIETCVIKRNSINSKASNPDDSLANDNFMTTIKNEIFTKNGVLQAGSLSSFSSKKFSNKYESNIPPVDISSNSYLCNTKLYDMHKKPKMVYQSTESIDINAKEIEINKMELKQILQTVKNLHFDDVLDEEKGERHQIRDEQCSQNFPNCTSNCFTNPIFSSGIYQNALPLLPSDMKYLIGKETIQTNNVLLLILEWNVDWLTLHNDDWYPPVLSQNLRKVASRYQNFENYYNTFFPLMMLETWHRMYISWSDLKEAPGITANITSYSVHKHHVTIECTTVFNTDTRAKMINPDVGKVIIVTFPVNTGEHAFKMFGFVTQCKTLNYNPDSISQRIETNQSNFPLCFTFKSIYDHKSIKVHTPIVINVLSSIQYNLKQNDALLYIRKSPLQRNILNPVANGLLSITQQNTSTNEINKCIQIILESIFSPRSVPIITVKTSPESVCSEFIPKLVKDLKHNCSEMKVLLCVRALRTLGRIAAQLILEQDLKFVIFNSSRDTNSRFHNFLLDNIAEARAEKENREEIKDNILSIKKSILLESDIILLPIKHSFDEILSETFSERRNANNFLCIICEADICTETETWIPILHGISKLILIGNGVEKAKVVSKAARSFNFDQSFFHRANEKPSPSEIK